MAYQTTPVLTVAPESKSRQVGGFFKTSGIVPAANFGRPVRANETFKWVGVGSVGGDVVVRGVDGNAIFLPAIPAGGIRPVIGDMILANAVIDGIPVTTTASVVYWYGGE